MRTGRPAGSVRFFRFYVFTNLSTNPTHSVGPIFRCTTKDRGERRAASSQSPLNFVSAYGKNCVRSLAPPYPTEPTPLGFGGGPVPKPPFGFRPFIRGFGGETCGLFYVCALVQLTRFRPRRRKLHITCGGCSPPARSFRCSSSPQQDRSAGPCRGPLWGRASHCFHGLMLTAVPSKIVSSTVPLAAQHAEARG